MDSPCGAIKRSPSRQIMREWAGENVSNIGTEIRSPKPPSTSYESRTPLSFERRREMPIYVPQVGSTVRRFDEGPANDYSQSARVLPQLQYPPRYPVIPEKDRVCPICKNRASVHERFSPTRFGDLRAIKAKNSKRELLEMCKGNEQIFQALALLFQKSPDMAAVLMADMREQCLKNPEWMKQQLAQNMDILVMFFKQFPKVMQEIFDSHPQLLEDLMTSEIIRQLREKHKKIITSKTHIHRMEMQHMEQKNMKSEEETRRLKEETRRLNASLETIDKRNEDKHYAQKEKYEGKIETMVKKIESLQSQNDFMQKAMLQLKKSNEQRTAMQEKQEKTHMLHMEQLHAKWDAERTEFLRRIASAQIHSSQLMQESEERESKQHASTARKVLAQMKSSRDKKTDSHAQQEGLGGGGGQVGEGGCEKARGGGALPPPATSSAALEVHLSSDSADTTAASTEGEDEGAGSGRSGGSGKLEGQQGVYVGVGVRGHVDPDKMRNATYTPRAGARNGNGDGDGASSWSGHGKGGSDGSHRPDGYTQFAQVRSHERRGGRAARGGGDDVHSGGDGGGEGSGARRYFEPSLAVELKRQLEALHEMEDADAMMTDLMESNDERIALLERGLVGAQPYGGEGGGGGGDEVAAMSYEDVKVLQVESEILELAIVCVEKVGASNKKAGTAAASSNAVHSASSAGSGATGGAHDSAAGGDTGAHGGAAGGATGGAYGGAGGSATRAHVAAGGGATGAGNGGATGGATGAHGGAGGGAAGGHGAAGGGATGGHGNGAGGVAAGANGAGNGAGDGGANSAGGVDGTGTGTKLPKAPPVVEPHPFDRYLQKSMKATKPMTIKALQVMIHTIYLEKIAADESAKEAGAEPLTLAAFVPVYFMHLYGSKKHVKGKLKALVQSLKVHAKASPFVLFFKRLVGYRMPAEDVLDSFTLLTLLWLIKKIIRSDSDRRKGVAMNMCDNEERMAIKRAGGDALVATLRMIPTVNLLADLMRNFDVPKTFGRKRLEQSMFVQRVDGHSQERVSLVLLIELCSEALLMHQQVERERLLRVFRKADADGSGAVDFAEFKEMLKHVPGLESISMYEVTHMFSSAAEEDGDDDGHGEPTLSEAEFVKLCQGKLKAVMGREILENLENNMNTVDIGYHTLLSDYVKKLFNKFDSDGTGEINTSELPALMAYIGQNDLSQDNLDKIMREIDVDGNEKIDYSEFLDWWRTYALKSTFDKFDSSNEDSLSRPQLRQLLESFDIEFADDQEFEAVFQDVDIDGGGTVSFAELVSWFEVFEAHVAFMRHDDDNSGTLEIDELRNLFDELGITLSNEALNSALDTTDKDQSGSLSFDEFLPLFSVLHKAHKTNRKHNAEILGYMKATMFKGKDQIAPP